MHHRDDNVSLNEAILWLKNAGERPRLTKPGCQTCTNNLGAGPRVNPPSLNNTETVSSDSLKYHINWVRINILTTVDIYGFLWFNDIPCKSACPTTCTLTVHKLTNSLQSKWTYDLSVFPTLIDLSSLQLNFQIVNHEWLVMIFSYTVRLTPRGDFI